MKTRWLVCLLSLLVPAARSEAQSVYLGPTVRLSVKDAETEPGLSLQVSSPYPGSRFSILALSPTRERFVAGEGMTDQEGQARLVLGTRPGAGIPSLNATLRAVVEASSSGAPQVAASSPVYVPLDLAAGAPGGPSSWGAFQRKDGILPELSLVLGGDFADLSSDGQEDLVVLGQVGSDAPRLRVLLSDGQGSLVEGPSVAEDLPAARALALADANGDGAVDVFAGTSELSSANFLYLNDGHGLLSRLESFPGKGDAGWRCNAALFADFDADGDADLYVSNGIIGSHGVEAAPQPNELLLNDGAGGFSAASGLPSEDAPHVTRSAAAGDVDSDGDLDLLIGNGDGNQLFLNDGNAVFTEPTDRLPASTGGSYGVEFADVDGDLDLDILYAGAVFSPAAQVLLLNSGGRQGGSPGFFEVGEFPAVAAGQSPVRLCLTVADLDGDGDSDLMFGVHELGNQEKPDLYLNQGGRQGGQEGEFQLQAEFVAPPGIYAVLPAGDFDGDGDLDVMGFSSGTTEPDSKPQTFVLENSLFAWPNAPLGFLRADANGDLENDVSDAIFILGYLFLGGSTPECLKSADVDDNDALELTDAVVLLSHLFQGGPPPSAPFPEFGDDATGAGLACERVSVFAAAR